MMSRVGAYIRLSKEDDSLNNESVSVVNQRMLITDYCKHNNLDIYKFYIDDGYSGSNFERPAFKEMIDDIENHYIDTIITKDISRLGREFIETSNYIFKYFPEHHIRFIAILEDYDSTLEHVNDVIIPFKTVINDMYLKDISTKIKSTRHNLMKQGLYVGSSVPYGYKRSKKDNRLLEIDNYAALIVKKIFMMRSKGYSTTRIANYLTDEGISPPNIYKHKNFKKKISSYVWKPKTISDILANEVYIGNLIQGKYGKTSLRSKKKILLPKSEWIIVHHNHEPIIDYELFRSVNSKGKYQDHTRHRLYDYLLKGLVKCYECERTMLVRRYKRHDNPYAVYCCATYAKYQGHICTMHYIREERLNELIIKELKRFINTISITKLKEIYIDYQDYQHTLNGISKDIKQSEKMLNNSNLALSELYKDFKSHIIEEDDFLRLKKELMEDTSRLKDNIALKKKRYDKIYQLIKNQDFVDDMINDFINMKDISKMIIKGFIKEIKIDSLKRIYIYYDFHE